MSKPPHKEEAPLELPIDGTLDLHHFRPQEIDGLIPDYIDLCGERGIQKLRIIHGKGIGTLRTRVHAILKQQPRVIRYHLAQANEGGWGATTVYIRTQ